VAELPGLLALAERGGDPQSLLNSHVWAIMHLRDLGDVARGDELMANVETLLAEVDMPTNRWLVAIHRCARLSISGTGDEIELAALEAFQLGEAASQPDALQWFAPQLFTARFEQGRMAEVIPLIRTQLAENPNLPTWSAALAGALVEVGELDEAAETVTALLGGDDPFHHDFTWLFGHCFAGLATSVVGTPEQAALQYERIAPYAGRFPCIGLVVHRAVDHILAVLAARAGWPYRAEAHFADAARWHESLGADGWLARTRLEWGRFLLDQGEPERARDLLVQARDVATERGMAGVAGAATSLLDG
jgi:hypothetical protein